jgi:hypothetical protein
MERLTYPFAVSFLKASATPLKKFSKTIFNLILSLFLLPNIGSAGPMGTLDQTENEYLETLD